METYHKTVITGPTHELPEEVWSSADIEEMLSPLYQRLGLPEGRLELMSGIKERRLWPSGTPSSEVATKAAHKLFKENDENKQDIDLLLHASVCKDFLEPATASVVHKNLELPSSCEYYDISNACLGVLQGMQLGARLIESGFKKKVLIVSGENSAPLLEKTIQALNEDTSTSRKDIKKSFANLTIGSAACAVLLKADDSSNRYPRLLFSHSAVDTTANHLCRGSGNLNELTMETDSEALLKSGLKLASKTWKACQDSFKPDGPDWVIGHQVGSAHEKAILEQLELAQAKTHVTYPFLGNTGSAALPVTLSHAAQESLIEDKERLLLMGIGSGLSCMNMGVQWIN